MNSSNLIDQEGEVDDDDLENDSQDEAEVSGIDKDSFSMTQNLDNKLND